MHSTIPKLLSGRVLLFGCILTSCTDNAEHPDVGSSSGSNSAGDASANGGGGDGDGGAPMTKSDISLGDLDGSGGAVNATVCAEASETAELIPSNLLFVVDKSGSMKCNAPPTDTECLSPEKKVSTEDSKWESTQAALVGQDDPSTKEVDELGAVAALAGVQGLSAGLIIFPIDDFCAVSAEGEVSTPIAPLDDDQVAAFTEALNLSPEGETPFAGAAIRGLEVLRRGVVSGTLEGKNYLVVMTDGVETCQPAALENLKSYVAEALEGFGIYTFVLGAPGSEGSRALLSELAFLGGTASSGVCEHGGTSATEGDCHVDLSNSSDFAGDLFKVFKEITASTQATCNFAVPKGAFVDPKKVNVYFTPLGEETELFLADNADCEDGANGWQYTSEEKTDIVLCGDLCGRVRADAGGRVDVTFGCVDTVLR